MLTERTRNIRQSLMDTKRQVTLERATLYMESYRETEGIDPLIRRAKALAYLLAQHKIVIDQWDLFVGNRSTTPRAGVVSPEMSPYWILDELDKFPTRPQDTFYMSEKDKEYYREVLYPFWKGQSLNDWYTTHLPAEVEVAERDQVFAVAQTDKGQGHIIAGFGEVLARGLGALATDADELYKAHQENAFYQASSIVMNAMIAYVRRYELVVRTASEGKDPALVDDNAHIDMPKGDEAVKARRAELAHMAQVLNHIATEPARDLYDALQLLWLVSVVLQHESNASSLSFGRMDQYLLPYYRASVTMGASDEELRELVQDFFLKSFTIVAIRSTASAAFFAGFPIGYNIVVGGVDSDGNDASNELSYLLLDVQKDTRLPQPNLSVRMGANTPDSLLHKASEVIRLGDGMPQIFNDEVNIPSFVGRGVSLADARDYAVVGCVELSIPGRMYGLHDISMFNMMKCLEIAMHEEPHGYTSFEELCQAVERTIDRYVTLMVEGCNICDLAHRTTSPTPFLSTLVHDCNKKGADITSGGARYNPSGVQGVGTANLSDSLCVIKHVIYDEKCISWEDLLAMLDRNWSAEGDEVWRQRFISRYPKYGNDIDEVDNLGRRFLSHYGHEVAKYTNPRDGFFQPGSYTVSAHIPLGRVVGASPDGRFAGEQLADGGLSPMVGRDKNGPTASLSSVGKLENILGTNGSLLNVKFSPATLAGEGGLSKLMAYLRAFSRLHIQHIQFNVVDRATLIDAQKHPERHAGLVVRVAGYSAMFVELSKAIQDDIINRTEHVL